MKADIEAMRAKEPTDTWTDKEVQVLAGEAVDVCRGIAARFAKENLDGPDYDMEMLIERAQCVAEKWQELRKKHGITAGAKI